MEIELKLKLWKSQKEIFDDPTRFKIVPKGRRYGITKGKSYHWILEALKNKPNKFLWIDTTQSNLDRYVERYFLPNLELIPQQLWHWKKQHKELRIMKTVIDFRSAERPRNIEGFGYNDSFLNEAGIILNGVNGEYLWYNAIYPMLMDCLGTSLIAGTPKGKNLFFTLANFAESDDYPHYKIFRRTTYDNENIPKSEIDQYVKTVPPDVVRQEIYGEFVDYSGSTWANCFKYEQHTLPDVAFNRNHVAYLTFDFNKDPRTCVLMQHYIEDGIQKIRGVKEFKSTYGLKELCGLISGYLSQWDDVMIEVTGDPAGRGSNALVEGNLNAYEMIESYMQLSPYQILPPKSHITHVQSKEQTNSLLYNFDFKFSRLGCGETIRDFQTVESDKYGAIVKDRNKVEGKADFLDCVRYYIQSYHGKKVIIR